MTNHKKQYQSKYLIPAKCWENAKFIRRVYPQKKIWYDQYRCKKCGRKFIAVFFIDKSGGIRFNQVVEVD